MDLSRLLVSEVKSALEMLERGECGFTQEEERQVFRTIQYYKQRNNHFDEMSARASIAQMYYFTDETTKVFAPFVDYSKAKELYSEIRAEIPDYNFWDFAVTLNLVYSSHIETINSWTRNKNQVEKRLTQLAVCFLNDNSNRIDGKIWWYVNA